MNRERKYWFLVCLLISISGALGVFSAWDDSFVMDEVPHVAAGYSYLTKQDMRLNPEHPPFVKDLAGIPLLFLNLNQDAFLSDIWMKEVDAEFAFGHTLIYRSGNDADRITRWARLPMLGVFALTALLLFQWGRTLYGPAASVLAVTIFCFSPLVIAHSKLVTTDMSAAFGVLSATYFFLRYLKNASAKTLLLSAISLGLALVMKFSLLLLLPYFLLLSSLFHLLKDQALLGPILKSVRSCFLLFLLAFAFVVLPVYSFHVYKYPAERQAYDTQKQLEGIQKRRLIPNALIWAARRPLIRAFAQYGLGATLVARQVRKGADTYFLGKSVRGAASYFPVVYFMKEPLAWWLLVLMTLGLTLRTISRNSNWRAWLEKNFEKFAMMIWIVLYWMLSISSNLNIGARHLLPVYPFTILLVSGQITSCVSRLSKNRSRLFKPAMVLLICLIGWYIYEAVRAFPYYLAYFNNAVGGPGRAVWYVVDSNLDWGQDLKRLARWVEQNGIQEIELDYFGSADPEYYMKQRYIPSKSAGPTSVRSFLTMHPQGGYLAVSATLYIHSHLYPRYSYAWLDRYKPITVVGHSIFVWKILPESSEPR